MAKITTTSNAALDLEPNGTGDINLTPGTNGDVNIPANKGLTFASDTEKIESNDTDLTVNSGGAINLTATTDVVIPADVGVTFGTGEKIEGNDTDLTLTSGGDIDLTATNDVVIPVNVGLVLGDGGEKIESNNTDLTVTSGGDIILDAGGADVTLKDGGTTFGSLKQASGHLVIQPTSSKEIILNDQAGTASLTVDTASQNVSINNGNLVMGSAGKGIDFSGAQTSASDAGTGTTTSECLNSYEEGSFTVTFNNPQTGYTTGWYRKVGDVVFVTAYLRCLGTGTSGTTFSGLPFNCATTEGKPGGGVVQYHNFDTNSYNVDAIYNTDDFRFVYDGNSLGEIGGGTECFVAFFYFVD